MSLRRFVDKIAVDSEPGLSHAQLMLTNDDLRPVPPERRKWGWWNFVAFWIADSANIVCRSCLGITLFAS
jgi:NCS1 family nucleobase:cation symporter-1